MRIYATTSVGRRDRQEDALHAELTNTGAFGVVCDGMGGHPRGDDASSAAVKAFTEAFKSGKSLCESARATVAPVRALAIQSRPRSPGTTLVAVAIDVEEEMFEVVWCGDSRAYAMSDDGNLVQITQDHGFGCTLIHYIPRSVLFESATFNGTPEVIVLVSDGVSDVLSPVAMQIVINEAWDFGEDPSEQLCAAALEAGSHDNVTAVVITRED